MSATHEIPEVSVIICTRNRRAWLAEAVASVEAQSDIGWEIIVADDASTDDTPAWLKTRRAGNFRIVRQEQAGGRAATANRALAEARGATVMFLDDDDLLRPRALATLAAALRAAPGAVAAVGARWDWFCDGRGGGRRDSHPWLPGLRDIFPELVFGWSAVSGQNLYRTEVVRRVGGYTVTPVLWPCDDRDLWLRVARCGPVVLRPEIVMTYRVHAGQSRPADLGRIRERVARRAIRALPRAEWRRVLRVRWSGLLVPAAEQALSDGEFFTGLGRAARAWAAAPGLWFSPLIGPWVGRRLLRRVWHRWRERWRVKPLAGRA